MEQCALKHTLNGVINWQLAAGLQTWEGVGFRAQREQGGMNEGGVNDEFALAGLWGQQAEERRGPRLVGRTPDPELILSPRVVQTTGTPDQY